MENQIICKAMIEDTNEIHIHIRSIRENIERSCGVNYVSKDDARMLALDSIQQSIGATIHSLRLLTLAASCTNFLQLVGFDKVPEQEIEREKENVIIASIYHHMFSLTIMSHFAIDNLFQNILRYLDKFPKKKDGNKNTGFCAMAKVIIDMLPEEDREASKNSLIVLTKMRNSIHSNLTYHDKNKTIVIDGIEFKFVNNKKIEMSWEKIFTVLKAVTNTLDKLLLSGEMLNIKEDIPHI